MFRVMNILTAFFIIPFIFLLSAANADELYISKNVRMHTEASLESPVTNLLLGGKKVEVLRIDGDFTEVQDEADNVGWIASEFLSDIEPANNVKPVIENKESITGSTKVDKKQEKAKPKPQAKKKEKKKQKEKKPKVASKTSPSTSASNKKISNTAAQEKKSEDVFVSGPSPEQLQNENRQLKSQLEEIRHILNITPATSDNSSSQYFTDKTLWMIIGGLLVGFVLGLLWNDFNLRRRHGGYKV